MTKIARGGFKERRELAVQGRFSRAAACSSSLARVSLARASYDQGMRGEGERGRRRGRRDLPRRGASPKGSSLFVHLRQFEPDKYLEGYYKRADLVPAMNMVLQYLPGMIYRLPNKISTLLDLGAGVTWKGGRP